MKVDQYAVSVQHGEGHHYFLRYEPTQKEAEELAVCQIKGEIARRAARNNKGAKPKVHVWRLVGTLDK